MMFVTGDTHAEFRNRFNTGAFPEQKQMTKDDYLVICGDFGGIWDKDGESRFEKYWLDWFGSRNYTLLFIDGNHENFDKLNSYPEKEWHGGRVHEIRPSVLHLMRGYVFDIDGKSVFAFGGAQSHDIEAGVFEPDDPELKRKKDIAYLRGWSYRVNHESWWKEELPSQEEMDRGLKSLAEHGNRVDLVLSHCCPTSIQSSLGKGFEPDIETDYLEKIRNTVEYGAWVFGHYHGNAKVSDKEFLLYEQLVRIPEGHLLHKDGFVEDYNDIER